jgi:hypothetical protein
MCVSINLFIMSIEIQYSNYKALDFFNVHWTNLEWQFVPISPLDCSQLFIIPWLYIKVQKKRMINISCALKFFKVIT